MARSFYDIAGGSNDDDDDDDNGVMLHGGIDKSTLRSDTCSIVYIIIYLFLYHLNALENHTTNKNNERRCGAEKQ